MSKATYAERILADHTYEEHPCMATEDGVRCPRVACWRMIMDQICHSPDPLYICDVHRQQYDQARRPDMECVDCGSMSRFVRWERIRR